MTQIPSGDPMTPVLLGELRAFLLNDCLVDGANLLVRQHDDRVEFQIMAVSTASLGILLATLTDPGELDDPASLSYRITPADNRSRPDQWQYELIASRHPIDRAVVFSAKVRLPTTDLPEVVARIGRRR